MHNIIVHNSFLVTSDHMLQKRVILFMLEKGMADAQMLHQIDFLQFMRNPNFKLAYELELL